MTPGETYSKIYRMPSRGKSKYPKLCSVERLYVTWAECKNWDPAKLWGNTRALTWVLVGTWMHYKQTPALSQKRMLKFLESGNQWPDNMDVSILAYTIWTSRFPEIPVP